MIPLDLSILWCFFLSKSFCSKSYMALLARLMLLRSITIWVTTFPSPENVNSHQPHQKNHSLMFSFKTASSFAAATDLTGYFLATMCGLLEISGRR